jgi:hypothetical protein
MNEKELIKYYQSNNKICPQPQLWNKLWEKLKDKERINAVWKPSVPLILAAWWEASDLAKKLRLIEHLDWAEKKGQLKEIGEFLYNLKEEEWYHRNK